MKELRSAYPYIQPYQM